MHPINKKFLLKRKIINIFTIKATKSVERRPPINPSQVFFGESSINRVFPKKKPKIYAKVSFEMTKMQGKINQITPS